MGLIRRLFPSESSEATYEPLEGGSERPDGERIDNENHRAYSRIDYYVFLLLGVAMLWAWCVLS